MRRLVFALVGMLLSVGALAQSGPGEGDFSHGQSIDQIVSGRIDARPLLLAYLASQTHGGFLPCGTYRLDGTLTFPAGAGYNLDGRSPGCVTFNAAFKDGDVFALQDAQSAVLRNFTVDASGQRSTGAVFHLIGGYRNKFAQIALTGRHAADGWLLDGGSTMDIDGFDCRPPTVDGKAPLGPNQFHGGACIHVTNAAVEWRIRNGTSFGWANGLRLTDTGGGKAAGLDLIASNVGILFDPSGPLKQSVWGVHLTDVDGDSSYLANWSFQGDGAITDVFCVSCWASASQSDAGMAFSNPRINGMQFVSADILANAKHGISFLYGTNISFIGPQIMDNGSSSPRSYVGVAVNPTAGDMTLTGGFCGAGGRISALGIGNGQGYCVFQQPGASAPQAIKLIGLSTKGNLIGTNALQPATGNYAGNVNTKGDSVAWDSIMVTPTAKTGRFGNATATTKWMKLGRTVTLNITITIKANGNAAGVVSVPLPFVPANASVIAGSQFGLAGRGLTGRMNGGTANLAITVSNDDSYPGADGAVLVLSGAYEAAD
jgi:hypothetical protein